MLYLASDHAGFELKTEIAKFLKSRSMNFEDLGNFDNNDADYPDYARRAAKQVIKTKGKAILFCGTGFGMSIVANRFKGIRAVVAWNPEVAILSREHNDANILALPSRFVNNDEAEKIVSAFLSTTFSQEDRHIKRIKQIDEE